MDRKQHDLLDTQQVEIIGRNLLISACIADGVEVSQPLRDKGIDLVIYDDHSDNNQFNAVPVQLKASSARSFSVNAKYAKFPGMFMAYTWHSVNPAEAQLYIMSYGQAIEIANEAGWLKTESWERGGYSTQSPSRSLINALEKYKYTAGSIRALMSESSRAIYNE